MKRIAGTLVLILAASVSAFAVQAETPAKEHFHAHVITHAAKYSYKAGKTLVKEVGKPIVYVTKQVV